MNVALCRFALFGFNEHLIKFREFFVKIGSAWSSYWKWKFFLTSCENVNNWWVRQMDTKFELHYNICYLKILLIFKSINHLNQQIDVFLKRSFHVANTSRHKLKEDVDRRSRTIYEFILLGGLFWYHKKWIQKRSNNTNE